MIASIQVNEGLMLEFDVSITGNSKAQPIMNFVIQTPKFSISIPARRIYNIVSVVIPKLEGIIEAGSYPVSLEITVGDKYFSVVRDILVLKKRPLTTKEYFKARGWI